MSSVATPQRLDGAPVAYLEPAVAPSLEEARQYCKSLAESHYENFHVASGLLAKPLRPHFHAVYGYCRIADDLGDEVADRSTALRLLDTWEAMLHEAYDQPQLARHPVFVALADTVRACNIPRQPFLDLLKAFRQDQGHLRYQSLNDVIEYSVYSANPVGRLVLHIAGYHDEDLHTYSDNICTGLQLANHWQDVGEDLRERDRIYVPAEYMDRYGVDMLELRRDAATPQFRAMMQALCTHAFDMLQAGAPLEQRVDKRLAATLTLFRKGGITILEAIGRQNFDTLSKRPVVTKAAKLRLMAGASMGLLRAQFSRQG